MPTTSSSGSIISPWPEMTRICSPSAATIQASRRLKARSVRHSLASSTAALLSWPLCFSSWPSKRSKRVRASAAEPAKPAMTRSLKSVRTFLAVCFRTISSTVTCPSPARATSPPLFTARMVVDLVFIFISLNLEHRVQPQGEEKEAQVGEGGQLVKPPGPPSLWEGQHPVGGQDHEPAQPGGHYEICPAETAHQIDSLGKTVYQNGEGQEHHSGLPVSPGEGEGHHPCPQVVLFARQHEAPNMEGHPGQDEEDQEPQEGGKTGVYPQPAHQDRGRTGDAPQKVGESALPSH